MEFLLENPFLIIILLGIISSFFKTKNNQSEKSPSSPKRQTGTQTIQKQQSKPRTTEQRKPMSPVKRLEQMASEMAERLEKEYAEKRKLAESTMRQAKSYTEPNEQEVKAISVEVDAPIAKSFVIEEERAKNVPEHSFSVEKQKVIDGVVWAEILGPPRAHNPHRSLRRK